MRLRPSSLLVALTSVAVLALLAEPSGASAPAAAAPTVTTRPSQLPMSSAPLANSMRGEYAWSGQATQPTAYTSPDVYYRDQVPWSRVETTEGSFDYSWFDDGMARARAKHGRFGFRVLAWCPGCFDNQYTHTWTQDSWVPSWLPRQAGTDIPTGTARPSSPAGRT